MDQLSAYEQERAKNIERNQAQLAALGLLDNKLIPRSTPKAAPKPRSIVQSSEPIRVSSRLAGKDVPSYADSARFLDDVDPDNDDDDYPRKKRGRPSRTPTWYDDADYDLPRRKRTSHENRPTPAQQHAALVAQLPPQPPTMPSIKMLGELRDAGVTEEHLAHANYPQQTMNTYKTLLITHPLTKICGYELMPFDKYLGNYTGKFKVQCHKCKNYHCLNKQGVIHMHSRCQIICEKAQAADNGDEEAEVDEEAELMHTSRVSE